MNYLVIGAAALFLVMAALCYVAFKKLPNIVWLTGGIVAIAICIMGKGYFTMYEAIISPFAALMIISLYSSFNNHLPLGGGTYKGLLMVSLYLGRYSVLTLILTIIFCHIAFKIGDSLINRGRMDENSTLPTIPFLICSYVITVFVIYLAQIGIFPSEFNSWLMY